MKGDKW